MRIKWSSLILMTLMFTLTGAGPAWASVKTITPGYPAAIYINHQPMEEVIEYEGMAFIPLRESAEALGYEITYVDLEKRTYLDLPGSDRRPIPMDPDQGEELYGLYGDGYFTYDPTSVQLKEELDGYLAHARGQGLKIAHYYCNPYNLLTYKTNVILNYTGAYQPLYDVKNHREDAVVLSYPRSSRFMGDRPQFDVSFPGSLAQPQSRPLGEHEAGLEIRQIVVEGNCRYSLTFIYQGRAFIPMSLFVLELEIDYRFEQNAKISYIGGDAGQREPTVQYNYLPIEGGGKTYLIPQPVGYVIYEETSDFAHQRLSRISDAYPDGQQVDTLYVSSGFAFDDYPMERYMDFYQEVKGLYGPQDKQTDSMIIHDETHSPGFTFTTHKLQDTQSVRTYMAYEFTGSRYGMFEINIYLE